MGRGWSILIGIGCLVGAAYFTRETLEFRRHGIVVEGTVIAVDAKLASDDDGLRYSERAQVQYTPVDTDQVLTLRTGWASSLFDSTKIGDRIHVRYLPDDPAKAREDSWLLDWGGPVALVVLGIGGLTGTLRASRTETVWWQRGSDD